MCISFRMFYHAMLFREAVCLCGRYIDWTDFICRNVAALYSKETKEIKYEYSSNDQKCQETVVWCKKG